jgi:hypothetical protein
VEGKARRHNDLFIEVQNHQPVIPMSPLRKLELLTRLTPSQVSFNHFSQSTNLLLSFRRQMRHSQTFLRLTTCLGALGWCLAIWEASPPRVTNASRMLDAAQSTQGCWKSMQMIRSQLPTREGWSVFYRNLEKLAIGAVRVDQLDRHEDTKPAQATHWRNLSLMTQLG